MLRADPGSEDSDSDEDDWDDWDDESDSEVLADEVDEVDDSDDEDAVDSDGDDSDVDDGVADGAVVDSLLAAAELLVVSDVSLSWAGDGDGAALVVTAVEVVGLFVADVTGASRCGDGAALVAGA